MDTKVIGTTKLKELQERIERWARKQPEIVKKSLDKGTQILYDEVMKNMKGQLKRRTGDLFNSVYKDVNLTGKSVRAGVYIHGGSGELQAVKARAHETGAFRHHGTQGVTSRLPKRPSFGPAKKAKRTQVRRMILDDLVKAFEHER